MGHGRVKLMTQTIPQTHPLKPNWMSHTRNMSRYVPKQQKLVITCTQMPRISWNISHGTKVPHAPYGPWVSFGTCHRWTLLHCTVIPPMLRSEENRLRSGKNNPTCETCEVKGRQCRSISSSSHGSLKRTPVCKSCKFEFSESNFSMLQGAWK